MSRKPGHGPDSLREALKEKGRTRRKSAAHTSSAAEPLRPGRNDILPGLRLETVDVKDLRPYGRRLRKSDALHIRDVANSIAELGFSVPLLIAKDNVVLDGETRLEAARLLGLEQVPCIRIDHLNATEQKLLRLAVNRLAEKGQWDIEALQIEFNELIIEDAPIEITGFGLDEVDQILLGPEATGQEVGDLSPRPNEKPIARAGDLFLLGRHRLLCGDATDPANLYRLMDGSFARLILTDEPYNVAIVGNVTRGDHREFAMASGEMSEAQFLDFNKGWIQAALPHLVDGGIFGTFIDWRGLATVHAAASSLGLTQLNLIVWSKTNAGMGSLYRSQHELLPLFKKGSAPHLNNIALGRRGRHRSNVWVYPGASSVSSDARRGLQDHPTVKPTAMLEDALIDLTNRADVVVDPFLGSGSTLMACEKQGRACFGLELDPLYVHVIIRRWETLTGGKATLDGTGETFEELVTRRQVPID